jgi:hypothetical protein
MSDDAENKAKDMEQMQLALPGEHVAIDYSELPVPAHKYTAERVKSRYPDRYRMAVKLIALGQFSDYKIGQFVNFDPRIIFQIRMREIKEVEEQRAEIKQMAFSAIMVLGDKMIQLAESAKKPTEVAVPLGISKDVYLQVTGQPTANIRVDHHFDFAGALEEMRKEAQEVMKKAKAHVVEPPALEDGAAA